MNTYPGDALHSVYPWIYMCNTIACTNPTTTDAGFWFRVHVKLEYGLFIKCVVSFISYQQLTSCNTALDITHINTRDVVNTCTRSSSVHVCSQLPVVSRRKAFPLKALILWAKILAFTLHIGCYPQRFHSILYTYDAVTCFLI